MILQRCRHCDLMLAGPGDERLWRCPRCDSRPSQVWLPDLPRAEEGSYPDEGGSYASVEDFILDRRERVESRELDFGLYWRETEGGSTYRAAWVESTEELYVVQSGRPESGGGHVEVLAVIGRARLERALAGWRRRCPQPGSLAWLRERLSRASRARHTEAVRDGRLGEVGRVPAQVPL